MEDNNQKNKLFLGMLIGSGVVVIAFLIAITVILAVSQKRLNDDFKALQQQQNLQQQVNNTEGEPTDIPPVSTEQTTQSIQQNTPPVSQNINDTNKSNLISIDDAKQIAINALGGGQVISQEDDTYTDDFGDVPKYKFDIKFNNKIYEIEVNAVNGTVYDFERD